MLHELTELLSPLIGTINLIRSIVKDRPALNQTQRIEQLYQPLFDQMLLVHKDYMTIFSSVGFGLSELLSKHPESLAEGIESIHRTFAVSRREYDGLRTSLRAQSSELIRSAKTDNERRFLWCVLCYFLDQNPPHQPDWVVDSQIHALLGERGYHDVFNSPSSRLLELLSNEADAHKLQRIALRQCTTLSERLSDIATTFTRLKSRAA